jgi:benzoylformate decarboxylase
MADDTRTGADLFVEALESYGVTHLFGNPGTTELPVMQALVDSDVQYVLGLHEDVAVGAASGYAMARRYHSHADDAALPLGVVNLHLAGGLAHGLGNLYDASVCGAPLLVTAGNHSRDFQQEEPILAGDLVEMTQQFTKWSAEVKDVAALPTMVRRAVRTALTPPTGPVFLALPLDVMREPTDETPDRLGEIPTAGRGDADSIADAAEAIAAAEEPVFVLGDEVARSGREAVAAAVELAEVAGARVHGEILAYEISFPYDHDQWAGVLSTAESSARAAMDTDTLVFVGCSTNTTVTRHEDALVGDDTECVHVTNDAWELGKHAPADVAVLGDPGQVLSDLTDRVEARVSATERERRLERVRAFVEEHRPDRPDTVDGRLSKTGLAKAIARAAPDALVFNEAVTATTPLREQFDFGPEQLLGTKGGGLGFGLPAAVGAAVAEREADSGRTVLGYVGDGSYLYYPHTLYTAARYDLDLTVVVPDNRNYRILKDNTAALMGGDPDDYEHVGMDFEPPVDIVANAESHGADGTLVADPDAIDDALATALDHDGPYVVDALIND